LPHRSCSDDAPLSYAARLSPAGLPVLVAQLSVPLPSSAVSSCACAPEPGSTLAAEIRHPRLAIVLLVRFYLLSQILLFHVVLGAHSNQLRFSCRRNHHGDLRRARAARKAAVGESRTHSSTARLSSASWARYLFVVGASMLLDRLGLSEELFWGSLLVFFAVAAGAALILSENIRWRFKRFISLHVYESKYDYRAQWLAFTRRLASNRPLDELAPQLLTASADAVGAAKGCCT